MILPDAPAVSMGSSAAPEWDPRAPEGKRAVPVWTSADVSDWFAFHQDEGAHEEQDQEALERLYETTEQSDWVNMYTAEALENRRLITVARTRSRSAGGQFPDSWASLNGNGHKWCERHFAKARGRTQ